MSVNTPLWSSPRNKTWELITTRPPQCAWAWSVTKPSTVCFVKHKETSPLLEASLQNPRSRSTDSHLPPLAATADFTPLTPSPFSEIGQHFYPVTAQMIVTLALFVFYLFLETEVKHLANCCCGEWSLHMYHIHSGGTPTFVQLSGCRVVSNELIDQRWKKTRVEDVCSMVPVYCHEWIGTSVSAYWLSCQFKRSYIDTENYLNSLMFSVRCTQKSRDPKVQFSEKHSVR